MAGEAGCGMTKPGKSQRGTAGEERLGGNET